MSNFACEQCGVTQDDRDGVGYVAGCSHYPPHHKRPVEVSFGGDTPTATAFYDGAWYKSEEAKKQGRAVHPVTWRDIKYAARCHADERGNVLFNCPGCGCLHSVATITPNGMGAKWKWNGDTEKPTFTPSVLVRANYTSVLRMDDVCHSFVTDGKIRFLNDCTHKLAGQIVDLPAWDS